jgi:hypothetical protein
MELQNEVVDLGHRCDMEVFWRRQQKCDLKPCVISTDAHFLQHLRRGSFFMWENFLRNLRDT